MIISRKQAVELVTLLAVSIVPNLAVATPAVQGNTITWTEEGWHQVQLQSTYESVCNGGRDCTVPNGVYTVINHGTGQRFMNIAVPNATSNNDDLPRAPVTKTGQMVSYAAGDDGDLQSGVTAVGQRFQDNGDGTFEDTLTGLTWLSARDCVPLFTWGPGLEFANNFSASSGDCPQLSDNSEAGDWRMPNVRELLSLVNFATVWPAWEPEIPFTGNLIADPYGTFWSSTSFEASSPGSIVYGLNSGVGLTQSARKTSRTHYIWPVRNSQ